MDEEQDKLIRQLHARRRRMMAQELKTYLSPSEDGGLWAVIGARPAPLRPTGKVLPFPGDRHRDK